jgi:NAD(P)-dependent dehydrogenase (short-subunit alcohol dehydrogenase family)
MAPVFRPSARALITGGASGIGYAVAELCLKHSMKVTIADFNQETLDLAEKNLKGDLKCLKTDVGDRSSWKSLKEQVGDVDFLMLNAGVGGKGTWGDAEYFDKVSRSYYQLMNAPTLNTKTDLTYQPQWCDKWPQHLRAFLPVAYINRPVRHCYYREQARHHQSTWQSGL